MMFSHDIYVQEAFSHDIYVQEAHQEFSSY